MITHHACGFMLLTVALLLVCTSFARAEIMAPAPMTGKVLIDGKLDEPAWRQAPSSAAFQWLGIANRKTPPAPTTFRLLADKDALYFGISCTEPKMAALSAAPLEFDGPVWERDCVEIFLDPTGKGTEYYQFMLSAGNSRFDNYFIERGNTTIGHYSGLWESAIFKGENLWTAEIKIPLSALYYTDASAFADHWLLNVARERQPDPELTTWAPLLKGFHEPAHFIRLAQMPKKDLRQDVRIGNMQAHLFSAGAEGYNGTLELTTAATKTAAGIYTLTVTDLAGHAILDHREITIPAATGAVRVPNVTFGTLGKSIVKATLCARDGRDAGGLFFPLRLEYAPLVIDVSEPCYANCIFPGQQVTAIRGTVQVNMPATTLRNATLSLSLAGPGSNTSTATLTLHGNSAAFSFPATQLPDGNYTLRCALLSGGKELAVQTAGIRKLPKPTGSYVYIDQHLNLVENGKPIFVRGWYGDEKYLVSAALLKNIPHPGSSVNAWHCQAGLEAERLDPADGQRAKMDVEPSRKVYDAMQQVIEANQHNPALRWYYLCDEPECRGISPVYLKYQYDFIKARDPYHPVLIITRAPELFTACADILNPHPYLNPCVDAAGKRTMSSPKNIRKDLRTVLAAGKGRIPAWFTPQAFTYGFSDPTADYPTFTEYRCMLFTAIANGCKGITPFIYYDHFNSVDLRLGCDYLYETLSGLDDFLLAPTAPAPVKITAPDDGVDVLVKQHGQQFLVVAVNLLDREVTATITAAGLKGIKALTGYGEQAAVPVKNGQFTLTFPPYGVHLLTSAKIDTGLMSVETFTEKLTAAKAALHKPGNILFNRGREIEWTSSDTYLPNAFLYTLTDGLCDTFGWKDVTGKPNPRVEMAFTTFTPKFTRAKLYSATVEDLEFWVDQQGEWVKLGEITGNQSPIINLAFGKEITTSKIKILMPKAHPDQRAELYEIELYD